MTLIRFRDDPAHDAAAVTLDACLASPAADAVRLEPADDPRALLPALDRLRRIDVAFPKFRDGRGDSSARILREAGYAGELRALGDVLIDQVVFLRRSGFDALLSDAPLDPAAVAAALARFPFVYQAAADGQRPIWALRHG